ncbi:ATP-binding protein [Sneathiella glossodoripedis]|uniref:ATP-binding protein n=1 Tax=Sneathiella glossodoripedis TaxID=418853 RepID=UPI00046FF9DA|nr:ATP-binding protein [Sneathiella glossodoripedis]
MLIASSKLCAFLNTFLVAVSAFVFLTIASASVHAAEKLNVLYIGSFHKGVPWPEAVARGFENLLKSNDSKHAIYYETLDAVRFNKDKHFSAFAQFMQSKYQDRRIDLIISDGQPSANFLADYPDFLPDAQRVLITPVGHKSLSDTAKSSNNVQIPIIQDVDGAVAEMIERVAPRTVYVVGDNNTKPAKQRLKAALDALNPYKDKIDVIVLTDKSLEELKQILADTPEKSAIFYTLIFSDGKGNRLTPYAVLQRLSPVANAPIFTNWETLLGSGIVGGYLLSGEKVGEIAARYVLNFNHSRGGEVIREIAYHHVYDQRQLKRWKIASQNLPENAQIRFKAPDFYDVYRTELIFGTLLLFVVSILVFLLASTNRKRLVANEASKAKSKFLANMSHEIRTPLNGVLGMAQILKKSDLNEDQRSMVETILSAGNSLLSIINDVLDMSKIEADELKLEEIDFDLNELVSTVASPMKSLADEKGLFLKVENGLADRVAVKGDMVRVRQIVWNLLNNAIKFTSEGTVCLSVTPLPAPPNDDPKYNLKKANWIRFRVRDTGKGISDEKVQAIFDRFTQEDTSINREYGGTGLGLSIVKTIVEKMGGEISVVSDLNIGTEFTVDIPFKPGNQSKTVKQTPKPAPTIVPDALNKNSAKLNVLLAEDNHVNALIATSFIENAGHTVRHVTNGKLAVEVADEGWPDLIIMDVHMPEMDGLEATKMIKSKSATRNIPVVGLTADAFEDRHTQFTSIGMDTVITKPFKEEHLVSLLDEYSVHLSA